MNRPMKTDFWYRFSKNRLAVAGSAVVVLLFVLSIFAPWISPCDPAAIDLKNILQPPSAKHWFGTDQLGRDVLSRMIWGAQISLKVGFVSTGIAISSGRFSAPWPVIMEGGSTRSSCASSASCCVFPRSS